jgi:hypothetical protein
MSSYLSPCFPNTSEQKQIDIFHWIFGRKKSISLVQLSVRSICVHFCMLNFYTRFLHTEQYTQCHHITDMPHRIPADNILLQTFFNNQQQQQCTKHMHTTSTTTTQQHWPLTITLTMARTPTKCKKKDDKVVIGTPTKCKKGGSKNVQHHTATNNANNPRQAPMAPAHPQPALAVTTMPTTPRRQAPTELMAPSTQSQMKTMLMPKRQPMAPLMQRQMKTMQMPTKKTDGTINADTDDDDADAKMMGDTPPYAQHTPQSQQITNSDTAESDSTQANKVAPSQNVSYFVTFSLMHTISHVILC